MWKPHTAYFTATSPLVSVLFVSFLHSYYISIIIEKFYSFLVLLNCKMAVSRVTADGNQIAKEFGGSEKRLPGLRGRTIMVVRLEERSFLVTMTKRGNSEHSTYPPTCPFPVEYRTSDWAPLQIEYSCFSPFSNEMSCHKHPHYL